MKIETTIEFERPSATVKTEISGEVSKHFGDLLVSDFYCDLVLTQNERDQAEELLCDRARAEAGPMGLPEQEPDAKKYGMR